MIIREKLGNISQYEVGERTIDWLLLEWYESSKRIISKKTSNGKEVILKFLNEAPGLVQGDIVYEDIYTIIVIDIKPCESIVLCPSSLFQMAAVCYEIGNKHLPLFYEQDQVLVPYEAPLFRLLESGGYKPVREIRKLVNPLKTTVTPHNSSTLFSKILQLTTSPAND